MAFVCVLSCCVVKYENESGGYVMLVRIYGRQPLGERQLRLRIAYEWSAFDLMRKDDTFARSPKRVESLRESSRCLRGSRVLSMHSQHEYTNTQPIIHTTHNFRLNRSHLATRIWSFSAEGACGYKDQTGESNGAGPGPGAPPLLKRHFAEVFRI